MTVAERFWSHVDKRGECWQWTASLFRNGYGHFQFRGTAWKAHRVAWILENAQEIPTGLWVLHACDNRRCVRPSHLRTGTAAENTRDAIERGRLACGSRRRDAKVTENDVIDMRTLLAFGATQAELGRQYGRGEAWMSQLALRQIWKHV